SLDNPCVNILTAPFVAEYGVSPGILLRSPTLDPIMMTRPPLFMCFSAACVVTNTPRMLMSITRSNSSSVVSSHLLGMAVPALFTRTSSRPNVATVFSTADGAGISGVRLDRDRLSASAFNLLDDRRGRIGTFRVRDGHVRSVRSQTLGDCSTNAARAARNECNLSFQYH